MELGDVRVTGRATDEGVLAGTGADDEDLHAAEPKGPPAGWEGCGRGGAGRAAGRGVGGALELDRPAGLHDEGDVLQEAYVFSRVTDHAHEIRGVAGSDPAEGVLLAEQRGGTDRRAADRLERGLAMTHLVVGCRAFRPWG